MPNIFSSVSDGVCTLTFDRAGTTANLFDLATLRELDAHLRDIAANPNLRGLILFSAKESVFIAGADLRELSGFAEAAFTDAMTLGQEVFNRLEALAIPTVAAIHGAAVGGGCEVALACRRRVASDHRSTIIGLPETKLGILPAWGGSTRLPRLIGVAASLDIILSGKTPDARGAKKIGIVDEVVAREHLREAALRFIAEPAPRRNAGGAREWISGFVAPVVAAKKLRAKTRGLYPAPEAALGIVAKARGSSLETSLRREREAVAKLAHGPECKNLMRLFFLTEKAKKNPPGAAAKVESVAVVGAGVMGAGIAGRCAERGVRVMLRDLDAAKVAAGIERVRETLSENHRLPAKDARDILDRIIPAPGPRPLSREAFVIEAAVERLDLKKRVFAELESLAGPDTILATNTSALSITQIAEGLSRPERVVGLHFFNPVHRMPLVEVVTGEKTSPEVAARTAEFARRLGKLPVIVRDSPGFVVNRILMPYLIEAARLFIGGAAADDIDEAMLDFGMPMGPLRLIDEVGLDVAAEVAETLAAAFGPRLAPPPEFLQIRQAGHLGRKVGKGLRLHPEKGEPTLNPDAAAFIRDRSHAGLSRAQLAERMMLLMVNEAARCVAEHIVESPADIDFAMVMGAGFAPFRGGPLRHADTIGLRTIVASMNTLGGDFAPCVLLSQMAENESHF